MLAQVGSQLCSFPDFVRAPGAAAACSVQSLQVGVSAAAAEKRYGAFFFSCFLFACFYSVEKTGRTSSSAAACKYLVAKCGGGGGGGGRQNANVLLSGFCTGLFSYSSLRSTYREGERGRGGMWTTVVFRSVVADSFGSKDIGAVFSYSRGPERCALPRSFPHKQLNLSMSRLEIRWAMFD